MPVYYDKSKKRWRFTFNRVIEGADGRRRRTRATKLLPAGWGAARRDEYDRAETARLYAVATGLERPEPSVADAVALYLDHRVPKLSAGRRIAQELAHLVPYIEGRPISQIADVCREYAADHSRLADGTLHNRFAYLKSAGRYAWKKHRLTEFDPTGQMEIPRPKNTRDVQLPVKRIEELLAALLAIDLRCCALYTLAFRIGSRWIQSVYPRTPADVSRAGRDVWLRIGYTKNGQPKEKWVHPSARWALEHLPFNDRRPEWYYDRFCLARAEVGLDTLPGNLKRLVAHDMRHVVATDIRKRGGSLEDVGAALDHISHASSARYAHITPVQVKRVLAGVTVGKKVHTGARRRTSKRAA